MKVKASGLSRNTRGLMVSRRLIVGRVDRQPELLPQGFRA